MGGTNRFCRVKGVGDRLVARVTGESALPAKLGDRWAAGETHRAFGKKGFDPEGRHVPMATRDRITSPEGVAFRDPNGNGVMEPYENPTLPAGERVADLLSRMPLEEKAGLMMMSILETGEAGDVVEGGGCSRTRRAP
jgi:hypothetical protein